MARRCFPLFLCALVSFGCDYLDKSKEAASSQTASTPTSSGEGKWDPSSGTAPPPATPPEGSWIAWESNGAKAEFPRAPSTETTPVPVGDLKLTMTTHSAQQGEAFFAVAINDYPPELIAATTPAALLDGARDGAAANIGGKLAGEKQIELDGHPARRVTITGTAQGTELLIDSVIVIVGNRLYQGIVARPASQPIQTDVDRFLASLHVPPKA